MEKKSQPTIKKTVLYIEDTKIFSQDNKKAVILKVIIVNPIMRSLLKSATAYVGTGIIWVRHRGFNNESPKVMPYQMATGNFWGFAF